MPRKLNNNKSQKNNNDKKPKQFLTRSMTNISENLTKAALIGYKLEKIKNNYDFWDIINIVTKPCLLQFDFNNIYKNYSDNCFDYDTIELNEDVYDITELDSEEFEEYYDANFENDFNTMKETATLYNLYRFLNIYYSDIFINIEIALTIFNKNLKKLIRRTDIYDFPIYMLENFINVIEKYHNI